MTPTELIDLLVEAQMLVEESAGVFGWKPTMKKIEAFANIVAAKEREACAKVCEEHPDGLNMLGGAYIACAKAIRARGEQT